MKKNTLFTILLFFVFSSLIAQDEKQITRKTPSYLEMMDDMSVNFYTVVDSAEAYFKTINRDKKGSGYKPFLRWKHLNEEKYFPSGDRSNVNPYLPYKVFSGIKLESASKNSVFSSNMWSEEGPNDMGVITGHYAAGMGRIEHVKVNPLNKNQIYIASRSGGLWRTNDEGQTWSHNTDFLPTSGANAIATKPNNFDEVIYNVQSGELKISFGIYRSTDGGNTFSPTTFVPSNLGLGGLGSGFKIYVIKYHPTIPNLVFIGTSKGLYRNTDNLTSSNWTIQFSGGDVYDINFHPTDPNIVYTYYGFGSDKNRIYKSTNAGLSYSGMPNLVGNNDKKIKIFTTATCPDCVFLSSDNGIWKSTDAGATNITIQNPAPAGIELWQAIPNDLDITKYVCGYVDMYRSLNSGANFSQCTWWYLANSNNGSGSLQQNYLNSTNYIHADNNYLDCINGVFYSCSDGFLSKSEDNGVSWVKLTENVNVRENYCLGVSQSNDKVAIFGSQDNGTSIKFDDNVWYEAQGADGMEALIHPLNYNAMIGSQQVGGRFRTYDKGVTNINIKPFGDDGAWIAPMFYDPNDHFTAYTFTETTYKSTDFGSNWIQLGSPTTFTDVINEAAIAENNSNKIVVSRENHLELSTNGGLTYTSIMNNLPSNLYISDVTFDPNDDNTLLVTYADVSSVYGQNKVFISYNSGASWSNITYNLGYMPIHNVIVAHGIIYVAAEIGVYYKSLTDTTWTLMYTNLPNVTVRELEVNYGANTLSAATWGRGYWKTNLIGRQNHPKIVLTTTTHPVNFDTPKSNVNEFVTSNIEYAGTLTNVYVSWAINNANFNMTDVIPMTLVSGNTWKTNTPLPNNYPAGTKIFFKVTAVGSNSDISETYKFMYTLKPFEYCAASGENTNGNLYIKRFQLANVDNNNTANNQYTYYNANPIILFKGDSYTATGTFNYAFNASDDFYVWIDYDKSAAFDANENVVANANNVPSGSDTQSSGTFTIPLNTSTQETRLRARYGYWGGYDNPCGTTLGEVEDYLVKIVDKPTITFSSNTNYCLNEDVTLTYTGSTVEAINWELDNGYSTFSFSGNTFTTNTLPVGNYTVKVLYTVESNVYVKDFPNQFKVLPTPALLDVVNLSQNICPDKVMTLTTSGGELLGNKNSKVSGNVNLSIPDNSLTTGIIHQLTISGIPTDALLTKIEIKLNITHPWLKDLRINLEAPNGKIINLFNQHGDSGDNFSNTVISSDISAPAFTNVASAAPFTGTYRASLANQATIATTPAVNSTLFSELFTIPNGDWKIRIYDDGSGDLGTLLNWSIIFTYNSKEIVWSPTTDLYLDSACTIPYDGLPINQNMYAKPTSTITYIAKAIPESCSNSDSVIFTVNGLVNKFSSGVWNQGTPPTVGGTDVLEFDDASGFTTTTDISGCGCVVKQGNVVINSGHSMSLEGDVKVQGGTLTVENGAALLQVKDVANTGNIIVKRNSTPMIRLDYTAWGSPVSGQQLQSFSPTTLPNRFYEYLYTGTTTPTAYQSVNAATNFGTGKGYMIRVGNDWPVATPTIFNGQFTGVPNNGNISIPAGIGYNLVGNPYPSPIHANDVLTNNSTTGTLYFWTHNIPQNVSYVAQTNYASYTTLGGTAAIAGGITPNGKIEVGQGFFVNYASAGNVLFNNTFRRKAASDTQFFRTTTSELSRYWLNLSSPTLPYNQILIGYSDSSSLGFDQNVDGHILETDKTILYSKLNTNQLVIQGRGAFDNNDVVPLGLNVIETGTYSISLGNYEGVFVNQNIYLKDNLLNIIHDLKTSPYSFTTAENTSSNRFEIIYQTILSSDDFNSDNVVIYPNPFRDEGVLNIMGLKENYQFDLYDSRGRKVFETKTNSEQIKIPNLARGVYIIKIQTDSNKKVEKKLVIE